MLMPIISTSIIYLLVISIKQNLKNKTLKNWLNIEILLRAKLYFLYIFLFFKFLKVKTIVFIPTFGKLTCFW